MSEIHIPCPACQTRIRFRSGLPDRDAIDCPQCGEVIPIKRPSRPRRPAPREDYEASPRRRYEAPPRRERPAPQVAAPPRYRAGRRAQNPEGHSAGFWVGIIGGCIGLTCLILGLIFFFHSQDKTPVSNQETLAETTPETTAPNLATTTPVDAGQQLVANLLPQANPTPTSTTNKPATPSVVPNWAMPAVNPGTPTATLQPGPDGVIPAPQVAGGGQPIDEADRLRYGWKANPVFAYRTTIKAEMGNETRNVTGVTRYQVLGHDPTMVPAEEEEEEEGTATGTGFVVHSDGYLMTCAHVIEGGTRIEVELGSQKYLARVVALNSKRDLALLQIAARNLPVLPLGNSSQVELAEHVRAVGYPLASVLGNSVKITQGSVAGFIDGKSGRMVQIDASINPGNSGGPLVNDKGDAIGVVSSGYFGSEIAEVGLAIPTDDVAALMRKHRVSPTAGGMGRHLDGPELAKKVTPSVAFLKVTIGPATKEGLVIGHTSTCTTSTIRNGRTVSSNSSGTKTESGKLLVDEFGQILHTEGANQPLPFVMGAFGQVAIEPISPNGEDTWGTLRMTAIPQIQRSESGFDPYSRIGGVPRSPYSRRGIPRGPRGPRGIPRSPFAPSAPQETVKLHLAVETCEYELGESTPTLQVISKSYEFQTIDDVENPYFRLSGKGTIRFDRTRNMPQQIHCHLHLQLRTEDGIVGQVPIEILCERVPDNEVGQIPQGVQTPSVARTTPQPPSVSIPPRTTPAPPVARPVPIDRADTLEEHLAILRDPNTNFNQKYPSLSAIKNTTPDDKNRKAVLDTIEPYLTDSNTSLQTTAIDAFGVWGTEDRAKVLFEMAVGYSQSHRWAAIKALGMIGGKKSAETVVQRLTDKSDMIIAARALKEMGRVAEEPVLKLIDHQDDQVRYNVYQILGKVGGPKSAAALKNKSQSDSSGFNRAAAQIALRDLQKRQ